MASVVRPLIGINGVLIAGESPQLKLATRYANAVLKAGGIPVALAPIGGPSDIERLLERVDGLLLSGGDDFDTQRLGLGPVHPAADLVPGEKQDWDFELARAAIARGVPMLGICYGMQLLGLAEGACIHQHLPDDRPGSREHRGGVEHPIAVVPGSKLARILDAREVTVVSRHHQALSRVVAPWSVSALDDQGLIEGIERADHPFAIGVQWHPELSAEGSAQDRLFRALIGAAAIAATQRSLVLAPQSNLASPAASSLVGSSSIGSSVASSPVASSPVATASIASSSSSDRKSEPRARAADLQTPRKSG